MNVQRPTPSRLFSLRLMFEHSKLKSLRDVSVTRNSDTLSQGFPQARRRIATIPTCNGSKHIIDFCAPFSPVIQPRRVRRSKGHIICGCAQDYGCLCNCFSLILCLFETCSKEKPSVLSGIRQNATLSWECVSNFCMELRAAACHNNSQVFELNYIYCSIYLFSGHGIINT